MRAEGTRVVFKGRDTEFQRLAPRALATAAAGFFVLIAAACDDEPIYNRSLSWAKVARFPDDVGPNGVLAAAPDGTVYVIASDISEEFNPRIVLYRYEGGRLEEFFRPPYERCDIRDVKYAHNTLWAAGGKTVSGGYQPYVATFDGDRWREIDVPSSVEESGFSAACPVSRDGCWFTTWRGVYQYDRGVWQKKFYDGSKVYDMGIAVSEAGKVFVPTARFSDWKVNVSDDYGATWHVEQIGLAEGLYRIYDYRNVFALAGETLYLTARLKTTAPLPQSESKDYLGIIKRDPAPAGQGRYELVFLASTTTAPVRGFMGMAFHDAGNGRAVGYLTSVALEHGEWVAEEVNFFGIYYSNFIGVTASYPFYWAILEEDTYFQTDASYWLCETR